MTQKTNFFTYCCGATLLSFLIAPLPLYATAACGEQAKEQYQQAMAEENVQQRIAKLLPLAEQCEHYPLFSSLGYNYYQQKQYEDADFWFAKAAGLSKEGNADRANAYQWRGTIAEEQNDLPLASEYFTTSLDFQQNSELEAHLKEINLQLEARGYSVSQIARALASSRGFIPALPVHFNYNEAKLTSAGKEQIQRLGKALNSKRLQNSRFILVGHTDSIGDEAYNMNLSLRRAKTVQAYLKKNFGISNDKIEVQGKGESNLRYSPERTKEDQRLNRRVEIIRCNN